MTAPPLKKKVVNCIAKRRFSDEPAARVGAQFAINTYQLVDRLYVYHCAECRGWHMTRRPQRHSPPISANDLYFGI